MGGVEESEENITLACLVLRDHPEDNLFPVTIATHKTIGELKEFIASKKPDTFSEADKLKPWRVEIPVAYEAKNELTDALRQAADTFSREGNIDNGLIQSRLGGQYLRAFDDINKCWSEDPPRKHIHVLIERPAGK